MPRAYRVPNRSSRRVCLLCGAGVEVDALHASLVEVPRSMPASPNFPRVPSDVASAAVSQAEGFAIRLPSAQLGDLIQINCLNRIRGAFRVSSGPHRGHLFFEQGQLIHADFGAVTGLDAVVQMLGW